MPFLASDIKCVEESLGYLSLRFRFFCGARIKPAFSGMRIPLFLCSAAVNNRDCFDVGSYGCRRMIKELIGTVSQEDLLLHFLQSHQ